MGIKQQIVDIMKKIIGLFMLGTVLFLGACDDTEDITPSMADHNRLEELLDASFPELISFKDKYGTYILYQFDSLLDFAYQFEMGDDWRKAKLTYLEKEMVDDAYQFLKENFISCYPDSVIQEYFPRKLLLCSKIISSKVLGLSQPVKGEHQVVANINSMTIAGLDKAALGRLSVLERTAYVQQIHYMYLAGYMVNCRRNLFVEDKFFDTCNKLYGTKIDRTSSMDEDYYMKRGFFPLASSVHYYPLKVEDLESFIQHTVKMDETTKAKVDNYSVMRNKIQFVVRAMKAMGVDIAGINPLLESYL